MIEPQTRPHTGRGGVHCFPVGRSAVFTQLKLRDVASGYVRRTVKLSAAKGRMPLPPFSNQLTVEGGIASLARARATGHSARTTAFRSFSAAPGMLTCPARPNLPIYRRSTEQSIETSRLRAFEWSDWARAVSPAPQRPIGPQTARHSGPAIDAAYTRQRARRAAFKLWAGLRHSRALLLPIFGPASGQGLHPTGREVWNVRYDNKTTQKPYSDYFSDASPSPESYGSRLAGSARSRAGSGRAPRRRGSCRARYDSHLLS